MNIGRDTFNKNNKLIYPKLSYFFTGVCFEAHNEIGRYGREKQYADLIEKKLIDLKIKYKREYRIGDTGNRVDFLIDNRIIIELKAKQHIEKNDYYQSQRYLQASNKKLALLINFRNRYLKPIRVVRIETDVKQKYITNN